MDERFAREMAAGYAFDEPCVVLGGPMLDGEVDLGSRVQLPLSMVNRHGLVAGATGTGKTKTLQILAGQLSDAGVPVFDADAAVEIAGPDGRAFAKGLTRFDAAGLRAVLGTRTDALPAGAPHEVVHRDDLVVLP